MANQDKDRPAGTEEGVLDDPATAEGTVPGAAAPATGGDEVRRGWGMDDEGGITPARSNGPGAGQPAEAAGGPARGDNGAAAGRPADRGTAGPAPLHRPAGFAAGYPQPDPLAYPPSPPGEQPPPAGGEGGPWPPRDPSAGAQPSPYAPYSDYGSYSGYGEEPGYAPGYPPPEYGSPGIYGEDMRYGPGPAYPPYGEGYGQGPGYPDRPAYGGPSGEGHAYGQEPGHDPARGYPAPSAPQAERRHHAPGPGQRPEREPGADGEEGAGRGAQAPDQGPGPYPPQDAYRWQPPPSARPGPHGRQDRGRADAEEAAQHYGGEAGYPPHPSQERHQATAGDVLAPLPDAGGEQQHMAETADDLTPEALLHGKRQAPGSGWRRALYRGTGGLIRPRESAEAVRRRDLISRVRTPVAGGHHRVAVMSLKGGVGKTTTCVSLGSMLASLRGDRIIALDANPDRGTLSDKVRLETAATVRDLLNERDQIQRYADVRAFTSQAPSRLEVLASDRDPAVSIAFSEEDYYDAARVLEHYYSISLTDCGTGLLHSAMAGVLTMADQIVLVSSPSVDGARSASATLDWLDAHDYGDLVRNAVVVLSMIRPRSKSTVDLDRLEHHFASRCRAVARIPYDAHLEEGAEVDLEQMSPATVNAYLVLAATVGDGFAWPRRAARQPGYAEHGAQPAARRHGWSAPGGLA